MGCYDVEEMEKYRDPIIPGLKRTYFNVQFTARGSRPLTANRIAQICAMFARWQSVAGVGRERGCIQ